MGSAPSDVTVNPSTNRIYVTYALSNKLSVIDGNTDKLLTTLSVGGKPDKPIEKIPIRPSLLRSGVAVDYNTNTVYVANFYSNQLYLIDGYTNSIIGNVTVGNNPIAVAADPSEHKVYVAAFDGTLTIIDSFQGNVVDKITLSPMIKNSTAHLMDVTTDPNTHEAYAIGGDGKIHEISRGSGRHTTNVNGDISSIAINPKTQLVYVARIGGPVSVFDHYTNSIVANITTSDSEDIPDVAVNSNTNMIYVTYMRSNTVSVINGETNNIVANITLGEPLDDYRIYGSSAIAVNPTTNLVYVTDTGSNMVNAINGKTNNLTAAVNFNSNPPNFGTIYCNDIKISNNYTRYDIGTELECTAESKKQSIFGFKSIDNLLWRINDIFFGGTVFSSWSGNVVSDSNDPTITFGVYKYGTALTANFNDVPQAYMTTILAIGIPAVGAWVYKNRRRFSRKTSRGSASYQDRYLKIIDTTYSASSFQNADERLKQLADIRRQIKDLYVQGTINDNDYKILNDKISNYSDNIYNDAGTSSSNDIP